MHILLRLLLLIAITLPVSAQQSAPSAPPAKSPFTFQEVMVPMRDGVRLQTVILIPLDQRGPLPILLTRTPYGVRDKAPDKMPASIKELAEFVPSIYQATAADFVPATQRIYSTPAMPSHIVLPAMP